MAEFRLVARVYAYPLVRMKIYHSIIGGLLHSPFIVMLGAFLFERLSYLQAIFIFSSGWLETPPEVVSSLLDTAGSSYFQVSG